MGPGPMQHDAQEVDPRERLPAGCDPDAIRLFIGHIPPDMPRADLDALVAQHGQVRLDVPIWQSAVHLRLCSAFEQCTADCCTVGHTSSAWHYQACCLQVVDMILFADKTTATRQRTNGFLWYKTKTQVRTLLRCVQHERSAARICPSDAFAEHAHGLAVHGTGTGTRLQS